jgi:hypothetical protein
MDDAEVTDSGTGAVVQGEHEHHPRADAHHQQAAGHPAHPREPAPVSAQTDEGGEAAQHPQGQPDSGQRSDQLQIIACGGNGVHIVRGDEDRQRHRSDEAADVQASFSGLAKDDNDEDRVDQVVGESHASTVTCRDVGVVAAQVERRLISPAPPSG